MRVTALGWPIALARVSGPSMVPTLRDGDVVLVSRRLPVRSGDVIVARYRSMPSRLVVKRAVRPVEGGWWLTSDNDFAGGDSAVHGVADPSGRVLLRWRRSGGWPVRRVPGTPVRGGLQP